MLNTRGERNFNPGNLRLVKGDPPFKGQAPVQTDDAGFIQFADTDGISAVIWGIRGIIRCLNSYARAGINTLQGVANRWAPPNENNSAAYTAFLCEQCNLKPKQSTSLLAIRNQVAKAIILMENGEQPYTDAQIAQAIELSAIEYPT